MVTASLPVTINPANSGDVIRAQPIVNPDGTTVGGARGTEYEAVPASQTDQPLGATGVVGDYLSHIVIQPTTTAAGTCTVKDGTAVIFTFTTGTLGDLKPITVPFNAVSINAGGWKVTTGANVAIVAFGDFT